MSGRRSRKRSPIREIAEHLGLAPRVLQGLREEGLFENDLLDADEADELRVAFVLIEEMGVNPPGVQVALHLRRRLIALEGRTTRLAGHVAGDGARRDRGE